MNQNMSFHSAWRVHNFWTKWTPPLSSSNKYRAFLKSTNIPKFNRSYKLCTNFQSSDLFRQIMPTFQVVFKGTFSIRIEITKFTLKWFFSSVDHNVPVCVRSAFENHGTLITTPLIWAITNWNILQTMKKLYQKS